MIWEPKEGKNIVARNARNANQVRRWSSADPMALASALQKLEAGGKARARLGGTPAEASSAFQSLYISAPFGGMGSMGGLFRTHPKTEDRVANLRDIARRMGQLG